MFIASRVLRAGYESWRRRAVRQAHRQWQPLGVRLSLYSTGNIPDILSFVECRMFGANVVTAVEGVWQRHRRITAPAFSQLNYRGIWDTVARVYKEFLEKEDASRVQTITLEDINSVTHKVCRVRLVHFHVALIICAALQVALFLISICGFGIPMHWDEPVRDEDGHLSLREIVLTVSTTMMQRQVIPKSLYGFGFE